MVMATGDDFTFNNDGHIVLRFRNNTSPITFIMFCPYIVDGKLEVTNVTRVIPPNERGWFIGPFPTGVFNPPALHDCTFTLTGMGMGPPPFIRISAIECG